MEEWKSFYHWLASPGRAPLGVDVHHPLEVRGRLALLPQLLVHLGAVEDGLAEAHVELHGLSVRRNRGGQVAALALAHADEVHHVGRAYPRVLGVAKLLQRAGEVARLMVHQPPLRENVGVVAEIWRFCVCLGGGGVLR